MDTYEDPMISEGEETETLSSDDGMPGVGAMIRNKSLKRRKRVNLNEEFLFRDLCEND